MPLRLPSSLYQGQINRTSLSHSTLCRSCIFQGDGEEVFFFGLNGKPFAGKPSPNTPSNEAARKSGLRKKGVYLGSDGGVLGADQGVPLGMSNISSDAAVFDMKYARWLEDYHHQMCELQAAAQEHLPEIMNEAHPKSRTNHLSSEEFEDRS